MDKNYDNSLKMEIGKRIDFIRTEQNLSKEKFSKLLNISAQHLGKVINGESGLSIEKIIELSEKTGFSTDFILRGITTSSSEIASKKIKSIEEKMAILYNEVKNIYNFLN